MKTRHLLTIIIAAAAFALIGFFALQNQEEIHDTPGFEYMPAAFADE